MTIPGLLPTLILSTPSFTCCSHMAEIDLYLDNVWTRLIQKVKRHVASFKDANMDNGEICKNTWECYAYYRWINAPGTGLYECDLVDPGCVIVCDRLSEFQTNVLLAWLWDDYLEDHDPDGDLPWSGSIQDRRSRLATLLQKAVYTEADSDGAAIEERQV